MHHGWSFSDASLRWFTLEKSKSIFASPVYIHMHVWLGRNQPQSDVGRPDLHFPCGSDIQETVMTTTSTETSFLHCLTHSDGSSALISSSTAVTSVTGIVKIYKPSFVVVCDVAGCGAAFLSIQHIIDSVFLVLDACPSKH